MVKLNRTTEYGLVALRHLFLLKDQKCFISAKEISEKYGFPFEVTAKTLQKLKEHGLVHAQYGHKGGYSLKRSLSDVSLAEFIQFMEGPQAIVPCVSDLLLKDNGCVYEEKCQIRHLMGHLNKKVAGFLSQIPLGDLLKKNMLGETA